MIVITLRFTNNFLRTLKQCSPISITAEKNVFSLNIFLKLNLEPAKHSSLFVNSHRSNFYEQLPDCSGEKRLLLSKILKTAICFQTAIKMVKNFFCIDITILFPGIHAYILIAFESGNRIFSGWPVRVCFCYQFNTKTDYSRNSKFSNL